MSNVLPGAYQSSHHTTGNRNWRKSCRVLFALMLCLLATPALADPTFDTTTPISFFTNVASRLLADQTGVQLSHLQVYPTNEYTPAMHRLLQVTANILDAENTNFYPSVFRPLFTKDDSGRVFIYGYQPVTNVTGPNDPQLAVPYDVAVLANAADARPISDSDGPVNVYGIPWVVGAKYGLPNFNQLSLLTAATVSRQLEITRNSLNSSLAAYTTNQAYIIGVSNQIGVTFWNSYTNAYPRPLRVLVLDQFNMAMTNATHDFSQWALRWDHSPIDLVADVTINSWPGSKWSDVPQATLLNPTQCLVPFSWPVSYQDPLVYNNFNHDFSGAACEPLTQLDQLGFAVTNFLRACILDGNHVIDYVQLQAPVFLGGLNQALNDPNYLQTANVYFQWSTNSPQGNPTVPYGVLNQLYISGHPPEPAGPTLPSQMPAGGQWLRTPTPMNDFTPAAEAAFFNGFFVPNFQYQGMIYVNRQMAMVAPYIPTRTVYASYLLQANDPLVHYTASDLNGHAGTLALWSANQSHSNGFWDHSDDLPNQPLPVPPISPVSGRYQPWGNLGELAALGGAVDANPYNVAYKDPWLWSSDFWNFPTGQPWNLNWIGQVHRGTPWQTIFLKSTNILAHLSSPSGLTTWAVWTGDISTNFAEAAAEALKSAPVADWQMVSLLAAMLTTNDLPHQLSVNEPDPAVWAAKLDGMTALTNTALALPGEPPALAPVIISSNSPQAAFIANGIQSAKAIFQEHAFHNIAEVLAAPELSVQSPFLNTNFFGGPRTSYPPAITDQAYEAIPSQLLPLLRLDALGQMLTTNGQATVQFTGYDGHAYALQASPDLINWTSLTTNSPVNGQLIFTVPATDPAEFYRTVLVQ